MKVSTAVALGPLNHDRYKGYRRQTKIFNNLIKGIISQTPFRVRVQKTGFFMRSIIIFGSDIRSRNDDISSFAPLPNFFSYRMELKILNSLNLIKRQLQYCHILAKWYVVKDYLWGQSILIHTLRSRNSDSPSMYCVLLVVSSSFY